LRYSKAFRSLQVTPSAWRSGVRPDVGGGSGNSFGESTAVSANGKVAAISATEGGAHGVVYVYVQRAGSWKRAQTLQPPSQPGFGQFGWAIALSSTGSTLIAVSGTPTAYGVFVYTRGKDGWTESAEIGGTSAQANKGWGQSVAISGSGKEVLVGAPFAYHARGAAYLYKKTTAGAWRLAETLRPASGTKGDWFGWNVALSGSGTTALTSSASKAYVVAVYQSSAGSWKQTTTLTESKAGGFGYSVALSADGSTAIVGAPGADSSKGAAYVFDQQNGSWSLGGKLSASGGTADDRFGESVAVSQSGTTALVGAPAGSGANGAAYVFTNSAGSWSQQAALTPSDGLAGDDFGDAVVLSSDGSTAVVGAPDADSTRGAAYAFQDSNGSWAQQAEFTQSGENARDQFGTSVSISASGDTAVVGALGNDGMGAVYVYTHRHGKWAHSAVLTASDEQPGARFGEAVAISGNGSTIAVGANGSGGTTSKLYIFALTSKGWTQSAEMPSPANECEDFAWDLSLSGDGSALAVGFLQSGCANYYTRQSNGSWKLAQKIITGIGNGTAFGLDVALSSDGSTLFIGEHAGGTNNDGEVLVYTQSDGKWKKSAALMAPSGASIFGDAVAASANGSRVAIASPGNNSDQGAMYIFGRESSGKWKQISKLAASDGAAGDALGFASFCPHTIGLTAKGTTAVIGAESAASSSGAAYAFSKSSSSNKWSQAAEFNGGSDSEMGGSDDISANGSSIVVGASDATNSSGVVYFYTPRSTGWTLTQTLVDP
jgi:hypothetical protein